MNLWLTTIRKVTGMPPKHKGGLPAVVPYPDLDANAQELQAERLTVVAEIERLERSYNRADCGHGKTPSAPI